MLGDMRSRGCGGMGSDMIGRRLFDRLGTYVQGIEWAEEIGNPRRAPRCRSTAPH